MPPPRVSPATPVVEMIPPVVASPKLCAAWSKSPQSQPPWTRATRASGSILIPFIELRSSTMPSSTVPNPGTLCPPSRTARGSPLSRAASTAMRTSVTSTARTTASGRRSIIAL